MLYTTLLPLALFALPSLSAPTTLHNRATTSESWTITSLKTHFMGTNSGLPGGSWPPNSGFNSTVSFTVALAPNTSTTCSTNWAAPNYPTEYLPCEDPSAMFQLSAPAGGNFSEANFKLGVQRTEVDRCVHRGRKGRGGCLGGSSGNATGMRNGTNVADRKERVEKDERSTNHVVRTTKARAYSTGFRLPISSDQSTTTYTAAQHITANDPSNPDSYLTCLGGAPLTGITCNQNGQMSVRTPLVLVATASARK